VRFREGVGQRFVVTIDTEEEFDWTKPLTRTRHRVDTVSRLRKFQQFCEGFGIVPIYLIDYPVATSELAAELLRDAVLAGRAEVGVQLHPWVNLRMRRRLTNITAFQATSLALERAKFLKLHATIADNFGAAPMIYRADAMASGQIPPTSCTRPGLRSTHRCGRVLITAVGAAPISAICRCAPIGSGNRGV
jgi:hypothetical protein